jgi:hypothetical protein
MDAIVSGSRDNRQSIFPMSPDLLSRHTGPCPIRNYV